MHVNDTVLLTVFAELLLDFPTSSALGKVRKLRSRKAQARFGIIAGSYPVQEAPRKSIAS